MNQLKFKNVKICYNLNDQILKNSSTTELHNPSKVNNKLLFIHQDNLNQCTNIKSVPEELTAGGSCTGLATVGPSKV